jgi:hypothetical protein
LSPQLEPAAGTSACPWPADKVERWPIERLIPYANHLRVHSEADLGKIAVVEWGATIPVLVDERSILRRARRQAAPQSIN